MARLHSIRIAAAHVGNAHFGCAGAGLLADVVAHALTGHRFPVMSYTNDKEEVRKDVGRNR